jgi:hypothetical protein
MDKINGLTYLIEQKVSIKNPQVRSYYYMNLKNDKKLFQKNRISN